MPEQTILCPSCGQKAENDPFYRCNGQPGNSVVLCHSRKQATGLVTGDITLMHCSSCSFIFNADYDPQNCIYDRHYEESQAHSQVFNKFSRELAAKLIRKHSLKNKTILEIGCGKGDFLNHICQMGNNFGIGYDPSYVEARSTTEQFDNLTIHKEIFPENYNSRQPNCIVCKMTLEHICDVHGFLTRIRTSIEPGHKPLLYIQVPYTVPILKELNFWDIYYEHCSYFTKASLTRLLRKCGFQTISATSGYRDQYLLIEAVPVDHIAMDISDSERNEDVSELVKNFSVGVKQQIERWQQWSQSWHLDRKKVALWGGGSKAVAFLSTLHISSKVTVVDINPHKQGRYMPGSGHVIVAPQYLVQEKPDIILVMNPVYMEEIEGQLNSLGVECALLPLSNELKIINV